MLGGIVGSAGGITSLISFPALLAVGLAPLAANATNIVALTAFWPGAAHGSQPELVGLGALAVALDAADVGRRRDWAPCCCS